MNTAVKYTCSDLFLIYWIRFFKILIVKWGFRNSGVQRGTDSLSNKGKEQVSNHPCYSCPHTSSFIFPDSKQLLFWRSLSFIIDPWSSWGENACDLRHSQERSAPFLIVQKVLTKCCQVVRVGNPFYSTWIFGCQFICHLCFSDPPNSLQYKQCHKNQIKNHSIIHRGLCCIWCGWWWGDWNSKRTLTTILT